MDTHQLSNSTLNSSYSPTAGGMSSAASSSSSKVIDSFELKKKTLIRALELKKNVRVSIFS